MGPFTSNVFITMNFFPHVYQLHALIYDLKFILELVYFEIKKYIYLNKLAPS